MPAYQAPLRHWSRYRYQGRASGMHALSIHAGAPAVAVAAAAAVSPTGPVSLETSRRNLISVASPGPPATCLRGSSNADGQAHLAFPAGAGRRAVAGRGPRPQ